MITRIQARNFRCLRDVDVTVSPFQILVGGNGSGKSSLLDVIGFLRDFVKGGPDHAIQLRGAFHDLVWKGEGDWFELAVEFLVPAEHRFEQAELAALTTARYEVRLLFDQSTNAVRIDKERLSMLGGSAEQAVTEAPAEFTSKPLRRAVQIDAKLLDPKSRDPFLLVERNPATNDAHYYTYPASGDSSVLALTLAVLRSRVLSAVGSVPPDVKRFGIATWFADYLSAWVQTVVLRDEVLRVASPRGLGTQLLGDGGNIPWVVEAFKTADPDQYSDWISHLRITLPDLHDVVVQERPDLRDKYLTLVYTSGVRIPSWSASAGTLRLIALTLLTYLPGFRGIYMIEEPENGVHPLALEAIYQSLNSVYDGQVLVTTHSPLLLSLAKPKDVLCFVRNADGSTSIIRGDKHPALQDWKMDVSLGMLFAGGVFG